MRSRSIGLGVVAWVLNSLALTGTTSAQTPPAEQWVKIDQGWSDRQKTIWYTTSQGSRLLPLSWLKALEQPGDSQKKFLDPDYIKSFRYLPNSAPSKTGLPVGFAIDDQDDDDFSFTKLRWKEGQDDQDDDDNPDKQNDGKKWVGLNCSACHTAEITFNNKRMRVEGGPTLADFQGLIDALNKALRETRSEANKAKRFAEEVLKGDNTNHNRDMLSHALSQLIDRQTKVERANAIPDKFYGFGRLDAFGHIYNKVLLAIQSPGDPQTFHSSNAPVSYPFLWNVPQHDKVQWNGIAPNRVRVGNFDVAALGRNVGEVTGVFADTAWFVPNLPSDSPVLPSPSITSSARIPELKDLERLLDTLRPPKWPTGTLGLIQDKKLDDHQREVGRDRGRELFIAKDRKTASGELIPACSDCHKGLGRDNLTDPIDACMIALDDIDTDPMMARNAKNHASPSGLLFGSVTKPLGPTYGPSATVSSLLTTTVADTVISELGSVAKGVWESYDAPTADKRRAKFKRTVKSRAGGKSPCMTSGDMLLAYKARPLTGIWATAPYLHNGSVPTLYDLLLPADQRPAKFLVGTREFDNVRVGYVTRGGDGKLLDTPSGDNSFVFNTRDAAGHIINGNSNAGHDYGNAQLKDDERWALIEYMKGL